MSTKLEKFIERAKKRHGDLYDYSQTEYVSVHEKVKIICREHGEFFQTPASHTRGRGCPKCASIATANKKKPGIEGFVQKSKELYGDRFDYSLVEYVDNKTPVILICNEHGEFTQAPNNHLRKDGGGGCKECRLETISKKNSLTHDIFIERAKEVHGDRYDYSRVNYVSKASKVVIICKEHGDFEQTPATHLNGSGCPECGLIQRTLTTEDFIARSLKAHGGFYCYKKSKYVRNDISLTITCPKHGDFAQTPTHHMNGAGCPACGRERTASSGRKTLEQFIADSTNTHGDRYDYSMVKYTNAHDNVIIICPEHGGFEKTPNQHLKGSGCPTCLGKVKTLEEFLQKSKEIHGDRYDYSKTRYLGSKTHTTVTCKTHGDFSTTPNNHLQGRECPSCAHNGPSKGELELVSALNGMGIVIEQSRRDLLSGDREIDIYVPSHNVGIEFNGTYWHSDKYRPHTYHQKKSLDAMKKGIQLIHVWEDDWESQTKRNIVLNKIKSKCGMGERVYARKCKVSEVGYAEAAAFLEKNHIQGYVTSKYIGLRYNGELVAVLGMKKTKDEGVYDLTRFATSKSVVGGFSKLLSHWKKNNDWNKIITYAHLDYSHGNLYHKNGFKEMHVTSPGMWYFKDGSSLRERREKYMKHKLPSLLENFDPNLTERENMNNHGYLRIYDAGSIRFELKNEEKEKF